MSFRVVSKIATNGIKLKADRLYKRLVDGGFILGCVIGMYFKNKKRWKQYLTLKN